MVIFILFFSFVGTSQDRKQKFPEFLEYKKLGFTIESAIYRAPNYIRTLGSIDVEGLAITSINFGLDYVQHPDRVFTLRYGVHLNFLPLNSYSFSIPNGDIPGFTDFEASAKDYGFLILSVPLEAELKKQMSRNIYFSAKAGINLTFLREGSIETSQSVFIDDLNQIREVFAVRSSSNSFSLYPNLRISPSMYYMSRRVLFQFSIFYQKALPNYFNGDYIIDNLEVSERTEGDYTFSGDQIGLSITLFLKKSKKRLKKRQERAVKNVYY